MTSLFTSYSFSRCWQYIALASVMVLGVSYSYPTTALEGNQPALVIIIDDIGNNWQQDKQTLTLPGPLTLAVLPHTPHGPRIAKLAQQYNKEIMLHAPMENHAGLHLGTGGLTSDMDEFTFKKKLRENIANIPQAIGINNHTGSALTELEEPMRWTMEVIKETGLFFVDSRTSAQSVAYQSAQKHYISSRKRDVFLDNEPSFRALSLQFNKAVKIAQQKGTSILIGHPYPTTIEFLKTALPTLDELGIRLVSASALIYLIDEPKLNNTKAIQTDKVVN